MLLYNSLTRKKELLKTKRAGRNINIFVCGPTVYDYLHIGNARTYLFFDSFVKYLRARGNKIFYLQNITDIDDKIIIRAREKNRRPKYIAEKYKRIYLKNMKDLSIDSVDKYALATKYIPQIIAQIKRLINKSHVYEIKNDGYYFDVTTFKEYGKLARRTISDAEDGLSRIDDSVKKRNKADFCVWKFSKPNEPTWKTELGSGRPGWHIEDTAISEHYFGPQYDLHGAGIDLKFPHHEAEIAQQESASGKKPFVKIWMHVGALTVNGKKMSKSLKNFISIEDFLKQNHQEILRWLILSYHYRSPLDYTERVLNQSSESFAKIQEVLDNLNFVIKRGKKSSGEDERDKFEEIRKQIYNALDDDFNTPRALALIFDLISDVNKRIWTLSKNEARRTKEFIKKHLLILGFNLMEPKMTKEVQRLAEKRELFRANKQFVQADILRNKINGLGYSLEDTPLGPLIKSIHGHKKHQTTPPRS